MRRWHAASAVDDRVGPLAGGLLELRPVHQALAAVGHQVGLGVAPRAAAPPVHSDARGRSNSCMHSRITAQYTMPEVIGPDLAGRHRHHHLVEPGHAGGDVAHRDQRLAVPQRAERPKVGVIEPVAELRGPDRQVARRLGIARLERAQQLGDQQVPRSRAVDFGVDDDPLGPAQPPACLRHLAAQHQAQRQPERAPCRICLAPRP